MIGCLHGYERMYRTGDMVRVLEDGAITFAGRWDAQVKIRGFHIELTEIEEIIHKFEGITDAVVIAYDQAMRIRPCSVPSRQTKKGEENIRKEFQALFTPCKIGPVEIKNRICMQPMGGIAHHSKDGIYTDDAIDFYAARAKGGVGLIITSCNYVDSTLDDHGGLEQSCPTISPIYYMKQAKELCDRVHAFGTKIFVQFAVFPANGSYLKAGRNGGDFTTEDMEFLVQRAIEAATICQKAGFDDQRCIYSLSEL